MKPEAPRPNRPAFLGELFESLTERGRRLLWRRDTADAPQPPELSELAEALLSRRGEASGVALAQGLLSAFDHAGREARLGFLRVLAERFGPDLGAVKAALVEQAPERIDVVVGMEAREQVLAAEGRLPDGVVACVGGGSNAIGTFHAFLDDPEVAMMTTQRIDELGTMAHEALVRSKRHRSGLMFSP
mgnify:CR=1 FL=1